MTDYFDIAFTPAVLALQEQKGSRGLYAAASGEGPGEPHELEPMERELVATRDSFYLATVSESGWPYVQHRGGDQGFVKILDEHTIGWVERNGNRQYLGTGNITASGRVAAIFVDYPTRTRMKLYGQGTYHPDPSPELLAALGAVGVRNDGAITVEVLATNWNCPKYITPRYTQDQIEDAVEQLRVRVAELEAELAATTAN
jgi:hypothetical protein